MSSLDDATGLPTCPGPDTPEVQKLKTANTLREEAGRARRLAWHSGDQQTQQILTDYALDLETQAQRMDAEPKPCAVDDLTQENTQ